MTSSFRHWTRPARGSTIGAVSKIRGDGTFPGDGFDLIRELIGDAGGAITFPESKIPHDPARKLLETLGVTIVDDAAPVEPVRPPVTIPRPPIRKPTHPGPKKRRRLPEDEQVLRYVQEALDRSAARAGDPDDELEAAARRWAA